MFPHSHHALEIGTFVDCRIAHEIRHTATLISSCVAEAHGKRYSIVKSWLQNADWLELGGLRIGMRSHVRRLLCELQLWRACASLWLSKKCRTRNVRLMASFCVPKPREFAVPTGTRGRAIGLGS